MKLSYKELDGDEIVVMDSIGNDESIVIETYYDTIGIYKKDIPKLMKILERFRKVKCHKPS